MKADDATLTPEEELAAWDAWKDICFVDGCLPSARRYLRRRIIDKMRRELSKCGIDLRKDNRLNADELITVFDQFLSSKDGTPAGLAGGQPKGSMLSAGKPRRVFKQHKEYVWSKVASSSDPPMQVINGLLLGPRGMVMDVFRRVMKDYYSAQAVRIVNEESGKIVRRYQRPVSLQETSDTLDGQGRTQEEQLADSLLPPPDEQAMQAREELKEALSGLVRALSIDEKVVLLGSLLELKASDPHVCQAIGRQKSTACALQKSVLGKLQQWYQTSEDAPGALTIALYHVLRELLIDDLGQAARPAVTDFLAWARCATEPFR